MYIIIQTYRNRGYVDREAPGPEAFNELRKAAKIADGRLYSEDTEGITQVTLWDDLEEQAVDSFLTFDDPDSLW